MPYQHHILSTLLQNTAIVDARRTSFYDMRIVTLKLIDTSSTESGRELQIIDRLYSAANRIDPRNHTVPILEKLHFGQKTIIVMPLLRPCDDPVWETVGEVISFLKQVFEVRDSSDSSDSQDIHDGCSREWNTCTR